MPCMSVKTCYWLTFAAGICHVEAGLNEKLVGKRKVVMNKVEVGYANKFLHLNEKVTKDILVEMFADKHIENDLSSHRFYHLC